MAVAATVLTPHGLGSIRPDRGRHRADRGLRHRLRCVAVRQLQSLPRRRETTLTQRSRLAPCKRCQGTGQRLRVGRHVMNYLTSTYERGSR